MNRLDERIEEIERRTRERLDMLKEAVNRITEEEEKSSVIGKNDRAGSLYSRGTRSYAESNTINSEDRLSKSVTL